jgi:hypothetical protein
VTGTPVTERPLGITSVALQGAPVTAVPAVTAVDDNTLAYTGAELGTVLLVGLLALLSGLGLARAARSAR